MEPGLCDPQNLIKDLNPQQMEAVKYYGQALLIGAGAGSGKTRVLTRRIAWLLAHGFGRAAFSPSPSPTRPQRKCVNALQPS